MAPKQENGKQNKGHAAKMPDRRYGYFRDDQIMFVVAHPTGTVSANLLEKFRQTIDENLSGMNGGKIEATPLTFAFPVIRDERFRSRLAELEKREQEAADQKAKALGNTESAPATFLPPITGNFSVLVCNLSGAPEEPIDLLQNIGKLRTALVGMEIKLEIDEGPIYIPNPGEGEVSPPDVVALGEPGSTAESITIQDVSPNWLMSAASQGAGTGGPGGLPAPFKGGDVDAQYEFSELKGRLDKIGLYGAGDNVDVAILDTAPCPHDLVLAMKEHPGNALLQRLLEPNGVFKLYPASFEATRRMTNTSLNLHDYKMTDHGLFAAGIIHTIVPKARIHLVEVLNQFGVGDLQSFVEGLTKVRDEIYKPGRKLVINCSWMLDLPVSQNHRRAQDHPDPNERDPEFDFEEAILKFVRQADEENALTLRQICNSLFLAGAQVVAAAGNDWERTKKRKDDDDLRVGNTSRQVEAPRPEARYPAGFVSAIGVGALPKGAKPDPRTNKYKASSYSNFGDKPAVKGILTLGGEEGRKKGVLGLYISKEYPVKKDPEYVRDTPHKRELRMEVRNRQEENAWAWWAGTSFATPIMTGAIAAALAFDALDTIDAVEKLYAGGIIQQALTDVAEDIMPVTQDDELPAT
jgi:hypothetical protein